MANSQQAPTEADEKIEIDRKKREAAQKRRYDLHVSLIREQDEKTTSEAKFIAWTEGEKGLADRLSR